MYKPIEPIRCPDCGEIVKVNTDIVLTSYPPKYHWVCPKCGKTGYTGCDTVALENQVHIEATTPPPKTTVGEIGSKPFIQQGWECPKCGAILAPNQNYCTFCSPSEYGRSNWLSTTPAVVAEWTNKDNLTPPSGQYTNPNTSTSISINGVPKVPGSCSVTFATPCETGATWKLEQ